MSLLLADAVSFWPYHAGQPVVDFILWALFVFVTGVLFAWGWRVANKVP